MFNLKRAIPHETQPHYEKIVVCEYQDPLIKLHDDLPIDYKASYYKLGVKGALPFCYLRKVIYEILLEAPKKLPHGYCLRYMMLGDHKKFNITCL